MLLKSLDGQTVSKSKEDTAVVEGLPTTSSGSVVRYLPAQSLRPGVISAYVRGGFCCADDGSVDGALLYGITLSRESGQDMERLLLLDAEERGLEAESCSMGKAAVNASNTSGQINLQRNLVLPKEYVSDD